MTTSSTVAGALFDFLGFLTSRDQSCVFGSREFATPAVELLGEWAATRGLHLDDANVHAWQAALSSASSGAVLTDAEPAYWVAQFLSENSGWCALGQPTHSRENAERACSVAMDGVETRVVPLYSAILAATQRAEPVAQSGVPFTRSAFHENRRSKWVTFNVRAEHADAAEAALNAAPPAAVQAESEVICGGPYCDGNCCDRPTPAAEAEPVVAWMRPDTQEVATDERKCMWLENGGGYASIARHFSEPLYTRPAAPLSEVDADALTDAMGGLLQAGLSNEELIQAWESKLPGVDPTGRELSAFAVGTEVGFAKARALEKSDWSRVHHALRDAGVHPGRTDEHLADVIARALGTSPAPQPTDAGLSMLREVVDAWQQRCDTECALCVESPSKADEIAANHRRTVHVLCMKKAGDFLAARLASPSASGGTEG